MMVGGIAFFKINSAQLHFKHADIGVVGRAVVIIFLMARFCTLTAANANAEIQGVGKLHSGNRLRIGDIGFRTIILFAVFLQPTKNNLLFFGLQFSIVLLQKLVHIEFFSPFCQRF